MLDITVIDLTTLSQAHDFSFFANASPLSSNRAPTTYPGPTCTRLNAHASWLEYLEVSRSTATISSYKIEKGSS